MNLGLGASSDHESNIDVGQLIQAQRAMSDCGIIAVAVLGLIERVCLFV